jgi:hypothetical protein
MRERLGLSTSFGVYVAHQLIVTVYTAVVRPSFRSPLSEIGEGVRG